METTHSAIKQSLPLALVRPSAENPRRDFGDIAALADRIRATGGQPVNPIIVVADGSAYRIVDGERRYRALLEIHGEQGRADALVYDDYSEAHAAVAMLATDDKLQLTDAERGRGFQSMLALGVDDATIAGAVSRKRSDIERARRVAAEAPEQATLDQMICAAEFEREEDRAEVLAAEENWERKAEGVRRRIANQRKLAELEAAAARLGVPVVDKAVSGYVYETWAGTVQSVATFAEEHRDDGSVLERGNGVLYGYIPQVEHTETEEERAARELEDRRRVATDTLRQALLRYVAKNRLCPALSKRVGRMRSEKRYDPKRDWLKDALDEAGVDADDTECSLASAASVYEILDAIRGTDGRVWNVWVADFLPAAADDLFPMSEEDAWLLELARTENERVAAVWDGGEDE